MSDIRDFRPHAVLEHRVLEAVVFQWDGSRQQALIVTAELQREMQMRDAVLTTSSYTGRLSLESSAGQVKTRDSRTLTIGIRRRADGETFNVWVAPQQWVACWLLEERLYYVQAVDREDGERMFRPLRPIIPLHRVVESDER